LLTGFQKEMRNLCLMSTKWRKLGWSLGWSKLTMYSTVREMRSKIGLRKMNSSSIAVRNSVS
jgi:hypothetical protein